MTSGDTTLPRVLEGLKVLELGAGLPVEIVGQLLVAFGAECTKIERPGGDLSRSSAATFAAVNHGKRTLELDLKSASGRAAFGELLTRHRVVVQGYSARTALRLGIDFDALAALQPTLLYCDIVGYSSVDPRVDRPGHDPTYLAQAGLLDHDALPDGWPGHPFALADHLGALYAAFTIVALLHRSAARATSVEVSLRDAAVCAVQQRVADVLEQGDAFRLDDVRGGIVLVRTADAVPVMIAAAEDTHFGTLIEVLGLDDLLAAPMLTPVGRRSHGQVVNAAIVAGARTRTWEELAGLLVERGVPHDRVLSLPDALRGDLEQNPTLFSAGPHGAVRVRPPVLVTRRGSGGHH